MLLVGSTAFSFYSSDTHVFFKWQFDDLSAARYSPSFKLYGSDASHILLVRKDGVPAVSSSFTGATYSLSAVTATFP